MSRYRPWLVASGLYLGLAATVTWPLPARLGTHLPIGRLSAATVAYFNLWTLEWNADRIAHGWAGYFDAPIFFPMRGAFALSEPQGATGLLFAPLSWALGGVAAYGVLLLLMLVANGLAMRRCVRMAGGSELAASCGGALAVALPFALQELGVLQLTVLAPPLLVLAEVVAMFREPGRASVMRAALWLGVTLWTCVYYALLLSLLLLPALVALACDARVRASLSPRSVALSVALVAAAALPLWHAQHEALASFTRSAAVVRKGSAAAQAYAALPPRSLVARALPALSAKGERRSLYPGLVVFGLAALGLRLGLRGQRRRLAIALAAACALAVLVSFGTRMPGDVQPYELFVQRWLPGFGQLRSPYRIAVFAQLTLVVLAGFAFDGLARARVVLRARPIAPALAAAALVGVALFETVPLGQPLQRVPVEALHEHWVEWLARQEPGAVIMLPPPRSRALSDHEPTALAMLQGLRHGHPLVGGYSGFFPAESKRIQRSARAFPTAAAIAALRASGARYAVAEDGWVARRVASTGLPVMLPKLFAADGKTVYALSR